MTEPNAPEFRQVCQLTGEIADPATDVVARAKAELDPDTLMYAYYYSFEKTHVGVVDQVLSAVATAGKAYHHTDEWQTEYDAKSWPTMEDRRSHEQRIQDAANDAGDLVQELVSEVVRLRGVAAQAAVALHWYMTGIPEQPPSRERIVKLIADLEARP